MDKDQAKIAIILVNYNNWVDTLECVESILTSIYKHYSIYIIDNCSNNNSVEKFDDSFTKSGIEFNCFLEGEIPEREKLINIVKSKKNGGFAYGNNIGITISSKLSEIQYFWLLNNDTVILNDTLSFLVNKMNYYNNLNKKIGILGSKLIFYSDMQTIQGIGGRYNKFTSSCYPVAYGMKDSDVINAKIEELDYVIGASMFCSSRFIIETGLMCEDYFLYFEELDWILRGRKLGWKIDVELKSKVYHKEAAATGLKTNQNSLIADLCQIRARILFTKKFYSRYFPILFIVLHFSILNRLLRKQFKRVFYIWRIILNPQSRFFLNEKRN